MENLNKRVLVIKEHDSSQSGTIKLPSDYFTYSFLVVSYAYTPGGDKNYTIRTIPIEVTKFSSEDIMCERIYGTSYDSLVELYFDRANFEFRYKNVYKIYLIR